MGAPPLRIGIDASALARKERTGVSRYLLSLVEALARTDHGDRYLMCYRLSRLRRFRWFHRVRRPNFRTRVFQEGLSPFLARNVDVFHGPDARVPRLGKVPLVATVHDVFSLDSDAWAGSGFRERKKRAYADLAARARMLVFVSSYSRDRFLSHFPVEKDRVRVVPEGVEAGFGSVPPRHGEAVRARLEVPLDYLLFVGQVSARKNVPRILEALARVGPGAPPLVVAGPRKHGWEEVRDAHRRLGLGERVRFLGHVAEGDLAPLYAGARALVFPSLDEGFGLPVLEAFACGTPVLASTAGALPETAGGAALLVDPKDPDAIAGGIRRLLEEDSLRGDLVGRGRRRAAEMTWDAAARRTLEVYREAVN
jgi:glycosyltransferase involved in cell wall biosynthesis